MSQLFVFDMDSSNLLNATFHKKNNICICSPQMFQVSHVSQLSHMSQVSHMSLVSHVSRMSQVS